LKYKVLEIFNFHYRGAYLLRPIKRNKKGRGQLKRRACGNSAACVSAQYYKSTQDKIKMPSHCTRAINIVTDSSPAAGAHNDAAAHVDGVPGEDGDHREQREPGRARKSEEIPDCRRRGLGTFPFPVRAAAAAAPPPPPPPPPRQRNNTLNSKMPAVARNKSSLATRFSGARGSSHAPVISLSKKACN
jgi:hypothetical protein